MRAVHELLIVGGGCTGALLSSLLPASTLSGTHLWEKSRSAGRMASSAAKGEAAGAVSDTGAQYFTGFDEASSAALLAAHQAGVLARLPPGAVQGERATTAAHDNYYAPGGTRALVGHYLDAAVGSGLTLHPSRRLAALHLAEGGGAWRAVDEEGGEGLFRAVALTLPVPQLLALGGGDLAALLAASQATPALAAVTYSSRFALAFHFDRATLPRFLERLPWYGRYVSPTQAGGQCIKYLSFETRKRGAQGAPAASFVAHSSVELGAAHQAASPELLSLMQGAALAALQESMGEGEGALLPPVIDSRLHRWKFSQVTRGPGSPAAEGAAGTAAGTAGTAAAGGAEGSQAASKPPPAWLLQGVPVSSSSSSSAAASAAAAAGAAAYPPLILAGDGIAGASNFMHCLASAQLAAAHCASALQPPPPPQQAPC